MIMKQNIEWISKNSRNGMNLFIVDYNTTFKYTIRRNINLWNYHKVHRKKVINEDNITDYKRKSIIKKRLTNIRKKMMRKKLTED